MLSAWGTQVISLAEEMSLVAGVSVGDLLVAHIVGFREIRKR